MHTYFIHLFNYQFKMLQPVDMFVLNNCINNNNNNLREFKDST